jgi:two-component system, chemotaxis family, protein-glutamate methylesterase/glutaminase
MFATRHSGFASPFGRVVLVASLGGLQAFITVLAGLPAAFPVPIVVVQHRRRTSDGGDALAAVLDHKIGLPVRVAESGMPAQLPGVTVIPGATTATIEPTECWVLTDESHDRRPGDAVLASSAGTAATIAVILTGYLADGAEGCRVVKRLGGRVLVQDPATARAPSMPSNAIATGCADFVLPLERLSTALVALAVAPGAADLLTVPLPPWARLGP